jgi:hypothetical protein
MSVITHHKNAEIPAATGQADRAVIASVQAILGFLRRVIVGGAKLVVHAMQAVAEARLQRAMIEAELYLNRSKHASKNEDDLPSRHPRSPAPDRGRGQLRFERVVWAAIRLVPLPGAVHARAVTQASPCDPRHQISPERLRVSQPERGRFFIGQGPLRNRISV